MPTQTAYAVPTGRCPERQAKQHKAQHGNTDTDQARPEPGQPIGPLERQRPHDFEQACQNQECPSHRKPRFFLIVSVSVAASRVRRPAYAVKPPSMASDDPVMNWLSADAR